MADQWYYTSEGRQMDPVSEGELKRLASRGLLKPTDLVWKEGMAKWERAGSHKELFVAAPADEDETSYTVKDEPRAAARAQAEEESLSERLKRKRRVVQEEETEDEEPEDYEERPRRRKKKKQSSAGLIWGVVGGAVALVAVIIGIIIIVSSGESGPTRSWSLETDRKRSYHLKFTAGKRVDISVKSNADSDVDLFVFPPNTPAKFDIQPGHARPLGSVAHDDRISKDCFVTFIAPASGSYEVVVWNRRLEPLGVGLGKANIRNQSNSGTLEFKESELAPVAANPPPQPNPQVGEPGAPPMIPPKAGNPNRPPRVLPLSLGPKMTIRSGLFSPIDGQDPTKPGCFCQIYTCNLVMGKTYTIDLQTPSKALDPFLRIEDAAGMQLASDDDGGEFLNSRIVFQPQQTGMYRIIATTTGPGMTGPYTLKIQ